MPGESDNHFSSKRLPFSGRNARAIIAEILDCGPTRPGEYLQAGMSNDSGKRESGGPKAHYKWPWFVLAALLLGIALAIVWMSREIERTRRLRDLNSPAPAGQR